MKSKVINMNGTIQLPSSKVVSSKNLWAYLKAISRVGRIFTKDDLLKQQLPITSKTDMGRILSYLKYLGVLEAKRESIENKTLLKWRVRESAENLYYLLQSERENDARREWTNLLKNHELFQLIRKNLLKKETATIIELQDFLREHHGRKWSAAFYRNSALFVAELFSDVGLIDYDKKKEIIKLKPEKPEIKEKKEEIETESPEIVAKHVFPLKIITKTDKFEWDITHEEDWDIVEAIVKSLRKKWIELQDKKESKNDV
jgi:hypothetical protein